MEFALGEILAGASAQGVCALEYPRPRRRRLLEVRLARWYAEAEFVDAETEHHTPIRAWLDGYFAGQRPDASEVTIDLRGTPFELSVWRALTEIPLGTTDSYGALAARALGRADTLGGIGVGQFADAVVLEGDPIEDIGATARIWRVVKDGRVYEPARLLPAVR